MLNQAGTFLFSGFVENRIPLLLRHPEATTLGRLTITISATSTYKFERQNFRHGRRNEPKFGTHVRIDTLTLKKKKKLMHPTPGGFRGLSDVVRSFVRSCRRWPRSGQNGTTDRARPTVHDHE